MAKTSKITKVEMKLSDGSFVDVTNDFLGIEVYDADGHLIEQGRNETRLLELDKKYEQILKDIVSK